MVTQGRLAGYGLQWSRTVLTIDQSMEGASVDGGVAGRDGAKASCMAVTETMHGLGLKHGRVGSTSAQQAGGGHCVHSMHLPSATDHAILPCPAICVVCKRG
jgi:hypothetical protein